MSLLKQISELSPQWFWFNRSRVGPKNSVSNILPSDANTVDPETTLVITDFNFSWTRYKWTVWTINYFTQRLRWSLDSSSLSSYRMIEFLSQGNQSLKFSTNKDDPLNALPKEMNHSINHQLLTVQDSMLSADKNKLSFLRESWLKFTVLFSCLHFKMCCYYETIKIYHCSLYLFKRLTASQNLLSIIFSFICSHSWAWHSIMNLENI